MRTQIKVADLSNEQFERLDHRLFTSYEMPAAAARVCVVFELAPGTERHVEMPVHEFAVLMTELAMIGAVPATVEAMLSPDALPEQLPMPDVYVGIAPIGGHSQ